MFHTADSVEPNSKMHARRRAAMSVLAEACAEEISRRLETMGPLPEHENIRAPETGLVMLRGRIGGDGAPFNVGEASVSRAVVRLATGEIGFGYTLGRDRAKARLIALCDALVQTEAHDAVEMNVIFPIRERLGRACETDARRVAATKVEFFTMIRGEG